MNTLLRYNIYTSVVFVLLCVCFWGCNQNDSEPPQGPVWETSRIHISGLASSMSGAPAMSLQCYLFEGNKLMKIYKNVEVQPDGTVELLNPGEGVVYFLSNSVAVTELSTLQEGISTLEDLLSIETAALSGDGNAELFYSGKAEVNLNTENRVSLQRSVAQLDLSIIPVDADIKVTQVIFENVSVASKLFEGATSLPTVTRTLTFIDDGGIGSTENIYQMYETDGMAAIDVTIHALYKGIPRIVHARLNRVKRNFKYTLRLKDVGTNLNGIFEVESWVEGNTAGASDDERIKLDSENSSYPSNVTISSPETVVVSPSPLTTTSFTLAFSAPFEVVLDRMMGSGDEVTVTEKGTETISGNMVSKFLVDISVIPEETEDYRVELNLKAKDSSSFRRFYIAVQKND